MNRKRAHSSYGIVEFDGMSGKVLRVEPYRHTNFKKGEAAGFTIDILAIFPEPIEDDGIKELFEIDRFDLAEYAEWYGFAVPDDEDIVNIGFWTSSGEYVEAEKAHREMF